MVPDVTLRFAVWCWAFVTLVSQWLFVYHIASAYGVVTLSGQFARWNEAHVFMGYVRGDALGNLAFGLHVLLAALVLLCGTLQLVPQIRKRALAFHRWNGRAFLVSAVIVSLAGLYMFWVRHAIVEQVNAVAVSLDALLVLAFATIAWRAALARDIDRHRRWALRTFIAANAVLFIRIFNAAWQVVTDGVGTTGDMTGPMNYFFDFACYLVPLAVLELYLRARMNPRLRGVTTLVLLLGTIYMVVGTVAYMPHKLGMRA